MGYSHMFYTVDLERLKALCGSADEASIEAILREQAEDILDNNAFFESDIECGECPTSEEALRQIVQGGPFDKNAAAMYGYILKIICEHFGEYLNNDVYSVEQQPFDSKLADGGSPIPIPINHGDFPEIGHLPYAALSEELARIDATPRELPPQEVPWYLSWLIKPGTSPRRVDDAIWDDMQEYRKVVVSARERNLSLVSFRH